MKSFVVDVIVDGKKMVTCDASSVMIGRNRLIVEIVNHANPGEPVKRPVGRPKGSIAKRPVGRPRKVVA